MRLEDDFQSDDTLLDTLESLTANSELEWINPADTGDLTSAPMLGILGEPGRHESGPYGCVLVGWDEHGAWHSPIVMRWAFMDYQVRSPLDDLADNGRVAFSC